MHQLGIDVAKDRIEIRASCDSFASFGVNLLNLWHEKFAIPGLNEWIMCSWTTNWISRQQQPQCCRHIRGEEVNVGADIFGEHWIRSNCRTERKSDTEQAILDNLNMDYIVPSPWNSAEHTSPSGWLTRDPFHPCHRILQGSFSIMRFPGATKPKMITPVFFLYYFMDSSASSHYSPTHS